MAMSASPLALIAMSDRYSAYMYFVIRELRVSSPNLVMSTSPDNTHEHTYQLLSVWHSLGAAQDELSAENERIAAGPASIAWIKTPFQRNVDGEVLDGCTFVDPASSTQDLTITTSIEKVRLGDRCLGHPRGG
jgi:hypothetical protein